MALAKCPHIWEKPTEEQFTKLCQLACKKKCISEGDYLEDYIRELLNLPDVRLASKNQVQDAIIELETSHHNTEETHTENSQFVVI